MKVLALTASCLVAVTCAACRNPIHSGAQPGVEGSAPVVFVFPPTNIGVGASGVPFGAVKFKVPVALGMDQAAWSFANAQRLVEDGAFRLVDIESGSSLPLAVESGDDPSAEGAGGVGFFYVTAILPERVASYELEFDWSEVRFGSRKARLASAGDDVAYSLRPEWIQRLGPFSGKIQFTAGPCPHVTWIQGTLTDDGSLSFSRISLGISEPVDASQITTSRVTVVNGEPKTPVAVSVITSDVLGAEVTETVLTLDFAQPLQEGAGAFSLSLESSIVAQSGHYLAGAFHGSGGCARAEFEIAGGSLIADPRREYFLRGVP